MFGKFVIGFVLVALAGYGVFEAWPLLRGPSLTIVSPAEGEVGQGGVTSIRGTVLRSATLTLNGSPLLANAEGAFEAALAFPAGTSILTFTASDRFGRSVTITRTIYVPAKEPPTTNF